MSLNAAVDLALKEAVQRSRAAEHMPADQVSPSEANPRAGRGVKDMVRELARDLADIARRRRTDR